MEDRVTQHQKTTTPRKIKRLFPPSTIGIIGGGQLGKMLAFDAKRMGYNVIVLDPKPGAPAGQVADEQIVANYDDRVALTGMAERTDVITYEFEHIHVQALKMLEGKGYCVYPSVDTLECIQNKFVQKTFLRNIGIQVPDFVKVESFRSLKTALEKFGGKMILKTCTDGYDGKGNQVISNPDELEAAYEKFKGSDMMAEEYIDFKKEVSILVARNENETVVYPVAENLHKNSILRKTLVPASVSGQVERQIGIVGSTIIDSFNDYGIFCIELFVDARDNVLVNEIAPRPHNSGHYSIEGCITSQYEQLVRVLTGMPLGSSQLRKPCAMYNILGDSTVTGAYDVCGIESVLSLPDCHLHLYNKPDIQYLKKTGHITVLAQSVEDADKIGAAAIEKISFRRTVK